MFSKLELYGGAACVLCMGAALYLTQVDSILSRAGGQSAQVVSAVTEPAVVVVEQTDNVNQARATAYATAADASGNIKSMVIDDVKFGTGDAVKAGDTVAVHYKGTLQNGQEFDNSRKRGAPFEFTVGEGMVIKGWDQGLVGMKTGGERILIIPPELAYGEQGIGPIPGGATLIFSIELVEIR
jgi:FKBP-type peptidyl-prolyl cis-trans isomerase